jgi:hypothetical protein
MMNGLQSHNLLLDDNRTKESLKLENDACEQLALDLGMASHVYTSTRFSKPETTPFEQAQTFEDVVADMSLATGALSINVSGPPPVHFGFLAPTTASTFGSQPKLWTGETYAAARRGGIDPFGSPVVDGRVEGWGGP